MPAKEDEDRGRWAGRVPFILACVGAAIGLGNVWRFPSLVYKYGGGPFFIPYLLALFLIGIPILILEFGLGQAYQSGDIVSFGSIHRRLRGVGFASCFESFVVAVYYNAIIAWALYYFFNCFSYPLPWMPGDVGNGTDIVSKATEFFIVDAIGLTPAEEGFAGFQIYIYLLIVFVWLFIFTAIIKGVAITGKVVYVTCTMPAVIILIMLVQGLTLPGAGDGIYAYIGNWDFSKLTEDPGIWARATTQIFFSIGITFGIMTAYASYNPRQSCAVNDAVIVALANSTFSIVSGFAVYSVLGFMAHKNGVAVEDVSTGGVALAFEVFPVGLGLVGGDTNGSTGGAVLCALFFLCLFLLGIDSAFAFVEAACTAVEDSRKFNGIPRAKIIAAICATGAILGVFFATSIGYHLLDIIDWWINSVAMLLVGLMECVSAGWVYGSVPQSEKLGTTALWIHAVGFFGGAVVCFLFGIFTDLTGIAIIIFLVIWFLSFVIAVKMSKMADDFSAAASELAFGGVELLRTDLNKVVTVNGGMAIPKFWNFCIKYFIPFSLTVMFCQTMQLLKEPVYGLPPAYQVLGGFFAMLGILMMLAGFLKEDLYDNWMPPVEKCFELGNEGIGASGAVDESEDAVKTAGEADIMLTAAGV